MGYHAVTVCVVMEKQTCGLLCCLLLGFVAPAFSQSENQALRMRPALIGTNANSLAALIKYPSATLESGKSASVRLDCRIDHEGKVVQFWVYNSTPDSKPFVEEVRSAVKLARFEPAIFGGKAVGVEMDLEIEFIQSADGGKVSMTEINATQNLRAEDGYVPPQRLLSCDPVPRYPLNLFRSGKGARLHMSYCIDTDGVVKDIVVTEDAPAPTEFAANLTAWLEQLRFIPPFRDGKPVRECYEREMVFQPPKGLGR